MAAHEITEGVVFDKDGVKVTAFEVDHGGEELPAYGYRIDYRGRAAVLSGDTTFNENLIQHAQSVDLIVHEVTAAAGSAAESPAQLKKIGANHTTPDQAAISPAPSQAAVFDKYLLFGGADGRRFDPGEAKKYAGPWLWARIIRIASARKLNPFGETLNSIEQGSNISNGRSFEEAGDEKSVVAEQPSRPISCDSFGQRYHFCVARHGRKTLGSPVGLRLLDALARAGDEVPPDMARAVHRLAAE